MLWEKDQHFLLILMGPYVIGMDCSEYCIKLFIRLVKSSLAKAPGHMDKVGILVVNTSRLSKHSLKAILIMDSMVTLALHGAGSRQTL